MLILSKTLEHFQIFRGHYMSRLSLHICSCNTAKVCHNYRIHSVSLLWAGLESCPWSWSFLCFSHGAKLCVGLWKMLFSLQKEWDSYSIQLKCYRQKTVCSPSLLHVQGYISKLNWTDNATSLSLSFYSGHFLTTLSPNPVWYAFENVC